ncbi:MAG: hypothetical protein F6J92_07025 [Symploca sp. SIO1A3]|nr:hypothetical protein [Symploca sp. SIO1A3]
MARLILWGKLIDLMGESMTGRMPVPLERLNLMQAVCSGNLETWLPDSD